MITNLLSQKVSIPGSSRIGGYGSPHTGTIRAIIEELPVRFLVQCEDGQLRKYIFDDLICLDDAEKATKPEATVCGTPPPNLSEAWRLA